MVGLVAVRCGEELQETAGDQVPHLLHLLTDQDPAVALAAVSALAKVYKVLYCCLQCMLCALCYLALLNLVIQICFFSDYYGSFFPI